MKSVAVIGMGTMGALIARRLKSKFDIIAIDKSDSLATVQQADIVILCVKPQSFVGLSQNLSQYIKNQTIVSVMLGIKTDQIAKRLKTKKIIRTMPNLGLRAGKSLTGAYGSKEDLFEINNILTEWGETIWLERELDFDGFSALVGCGPAYYFELTRQLEESAAKLGFNNELARKMANGTLVSAAAILGEESAKKTIEQVASKGGATEAALKVFTSRKWGQIVDEAVKAAQTKSKELSDE